jgi:hypothetical protein
MAQELGLGNGANLYVVAPNLVSNGTNEAGDRLVDSVRGVHWRPVIICAQDCGGRIDH